MGYVAAGCSSGHHTILDFPMRSGARNSFPAYFEDFAAGDFPVVTASMDCRKCISKVAHIEAQILDAPVVCARSVDQVPTRRGGDFQYRGVWPVAFKMYPGRRELDGWISDQICSRRHIANAAARRDCV